MLEDIRLKPPIGHVVYRWFNKFLWLECVKCGKGRYVQLAKTKMPEYTGLCDDCRKRRPKGKGYHLAAGYKAVRLFSDDFFYPMAKTNEFVLEHRLVMAKHIGRCLHSWEHIHHKNGIKLDNRIENLKLTNNSDHKLEHSKGYRDGYLKGMTDGRDQRISNLLEEIKTLKNLEVRNEQTR